MFELSKEVLKFLQDHEQETFDLIETLSKIPAPSGKEELRVEFCKKWFEDNGAPEVIVDSALNVICPVGCENKNDIVIFMAHTDVVFPDMTELPFHKDDEYMYCPGIGDDTACLAKLMIVAKYIFQKGLTAPCGIMFIANSCEEGLGNLKGIRQIMKDYAGRVAEVYTFDGSYTHIVNRCVGSHRYELTFKTEGGHSFGAFGNRNAIVAMSDLICNLYKCEVPKKDGCKTTYNVGIVEGGTSVNTIAQEAKMLFEYRSDDKECLAHMENFFKEEVEKAKKKGLAEIEVELIGDRPCGGEIDKEKHQKMCDLAISVSEKYSGLPCKIDSGSTDANIPMSLGVPAICAGNHIAYGAHTRGEKLLISSVPIGLKITAEIVLTYFQK